ncbi:DUF5819 family protein [Aeromicrobium sp. Leaf350]|uniref:DUF5819 family protein n=1 Tax=Aeromicrobium sp. Leaf350 TaxID=2876565 RepID=UPI001E60B701|nr:DUF5819 family protein [Aeromicrobium sp. Leaf350]
MSATTAEVSVTRWQSGLMLTIALVVIVHSAVVGLWLSPVSPIRDSVGSSTLASYVNPYFRQSPATIDPGLQRADEALLVRARLLATDGTVVETEWVDVTQQLERGGLLRPRIDRAARSLATNLNVAIASFPASARPLVEQDLTEDDRAVRQVEIEAEGASPFLAQTFFANWAMATQFGTLFTTARTDGTVEEIQVRIGLRRVPSYDDRAGESLADEPYEWTTLGWRDAIAGNEEAQRAFDDYVGGDEGA